MSRRILWILLTAANVGLGVAAVIPTMLSAMMFDAPGSESSPLTIALAIAVIAFPVLCFVGAVLPWKARNKGYAGWFFGLPLLSAVAVGALFLAIDVLCGGSLVCRI